MSQADGREEEMLANLKKLDQVQPGAFGRYERLVDEAIADALVERTVRLVEHVRATCGEAEAERVLEQLEAATATMPAAATRPTR